MSKTTNFVFADVCLSCSTKWLPNFPAVHNVFIQVFQAHFFFFLHKVFSSLYPPLDSNCLIIFLISLPSPLDTFRLEANPCLPIIEILAGEFRLSAHNFYCIVTREPRSPVLAAQSSVRF